MRRRALIPLALVSLGCGTDPVKDKEIDSLGGEQKGVEPGPLHRPGQPCVVCHDGDGPGNMEFSLAGTVYQALGATEPLVGAYIRFVDSYGKQYKTATNCAGNFYVQPGDYDPKFPVWIKLEYAGVPQEMGSPIFRERSCGSCHKAPAGPESAGPIYFAPAPFPPPPNGCKK